MVRIDERLKRIRQRFVDQGKYFVINRGRQYGKTTTLMALAEDLKDDYEVFFMDFQMMSSANFENESSFVKAFIEYMEDLLSGKKRSGERISEDAFHNLLLLKEQETVSMDKLFRGISRVCETSEKPVVFLALLRRYYLDRENSPAFYSVILAGVYDIKNLRLKIRSEEEHRYNSPWNIAAKFELDMNFSVKQIASMLEEYEAEHHTGMDMEEVSSCIYEYTSGYPYLVSAVYKLLDEELPETGKFENSSNIWTKEGISEAVGMLLDENIPLFDSMIKQIYEYPGMKAMLHAILFQGKRLTYNPDNPAINLAFMFGYIVNKEKTVRVANRIFEMRLYNAFLSEEELTATIYHAAQENRNQFLDGFHLNMDLTIQNRLLETVATGERKMTKMFPIFLDIADKEIHVYGAGKIATRRVETLLLFTPCLTVHAPEVSAQLQKAALEGKLRIQREIYQPGSIPGDTFMVLAATDDFAVNNSIYEECREKGILVNVCSDQEQCDFHFPGIAVKDDLVIGINAGGKDHRLAKRWTDKIRKEVEEDGYDIQTEKASDNSKSQEDGT